MSAQDVSNRNLCGHRPHLHLHYNSHAPLPARLLAMTQPKRLQFVSRSYPIYFVTACAEDRRPILDNPGIHHAFTTFAKAAAEHQTWVGRYVIMPDHLHLFVAFSPGSISLSGWMKSLKNYLSRTLRRNGASAPHWQKGFFDRLLRSGDSYTEKWEYVRLNPVRAGLVPDAADWPYQGEIHPLTMTDR